jgi:hypothetical protein
MNTIKSQVKEVFNLIIFIASITLLVLHIKLILLAYFLCLLNINIIQLRKEIIKLLLLWFLFSWFWGYEIKKVIIHKQVIFIFLVLILHVIIFDLMIISSLHLVWVTDVWKEVIILSDILSWKLEILLSHLKSIISSIWLNRFILIHRKQIHKFLRSTW